MPVATPYIARQPSVMMGAVPVELRGHGNTVRLTAEDNMADVDTFDNPEGEAPGTTKWTFEMDLLQSYGPEGGNAGLWDTLRPVAKTVQPFVVVPTEGVVSPTNPEATFEAWVPTIPFLDSARGDSTRLTVTFSVVGEPVFATTP